MDCEVKLKRDRTGRIKIEDQFEGLPSSLFKVIK